MFIKYLKIFIFCFIKRVINRVPAIVGIPDSGSNNLLSVVKASVYISVQALSSNYGMKTDDAIYNYIYSFLTILVKVFLSSIRAVLNRQAHLRHLINFTAGA